MLDKLRKRKLISIPVICLGIVLLFWLLAFTPRDRGVLLSKHQYFTHNGLERSYLISKPKQTNEQTKIVIGLHGFSDSARRFAYYTALHNAVGNHDIVLYPSAIPPQSNQEKAGWNAGFCCGSGWVNNIDDGGFIVDLAAHVAKQSGVNQNNAFVTGFSNGGFMAQKIATDYPERVKAVSISSGSIGTNSDKLSPAQPVAILLMHGEQDTIVPFEGGAGSSDPDFVWLSFEQTKQTWQQVNGDEAEVKTKTYPDNGHTWNGWRILNFWHRNPEASIRTGEFFNEQ